MRTKVKHLLLKLNIDELIFDISFAFLITILQIAFSKSGLFFIEHFHPLLLIMFGLSVQFVLSFKLGSLMKRFQKHSKKWLINLFGSLSFIFIFPMLFFIVAGILFETGYDKENSWVFILALINILAAYIIGQNFETKNIEAKNEKTKSKTNIMVVLTAVSLAFLNFGFYEMISGTPTNGSIEETIAFLAIMVISGFLPFRMMMMFAPPKNRINTIIGSLVITYDFFLLYFQTF